jgi:DNA-directed RNA polymerase subunit RPC12/RpoP
VSLERPKPIAGVHELRRMVRGRLGTGTLACPDCDAPVLGAGPMAVTDALACPYCGHAAVVRDFLSLAPPTRPARVAVRVRVAHRPRR